MSARKAAEMTRRWEGRFAAVARGASTARRVVWTHRGRNSSVMPSEADLQLLFARLNYRVFQRRSSRLPHPIQRALFELRRPNHLYRSPAGYRALAEALSPAIPRRWRRRCCTRWSTRGVTPVSRYRPRRALQAEVARVRPRIDLPRPRQRPPAHASRASATSCAASTAPSRCCAARSRASRRVVRAATRVASTPAIR